ncbi:MAG: hypothetical protein B2I17_01985 [Thermoplasmatales archaeon B_DKE]|nr:MAG: hypothetical protein B2I17_01985 [Thermoplasmatales archaeon B_DKE]
MGEDMTLIKNRIHAMPSAYGIRTNATDIFGRCGLRETESSSQRFRASNSAVLTDMTKRVSEIRNHESIMEDGISRIASDRNDFALQVTIPGVHVYSAAAILAEIDDISRFPSKEKLAVYAGLVPRQDKSGSSYIRGHISKHGPSVLRFILVTAAHMVIKYSKRMKHKYLSIVRRLGKNLTIVAIACLLLETIYMMLSRNTKFIDSIDTLTEKKQKAMCERSKNPARTAKLDEAIKLIREKSQKKPFS